VRKDLLFKIGIVVVLLAGVLVFIPGLLPFRTNKEIVAEWCVIFFIAILFKNRWAGLFILWVLINQILSTYTPVVGLNKAYILGLHLVVIYAFFYSLFVQYVNKNNLNLVFDIIGCMAIFQVLMMLFQYNGLWIGILPLQYQSMEVVAKLKLHELFYIYQFKDIAGNNIPGFMDMVNTASGLLAVSLPVFFRKKWYWGIPFIFAGLWMSRSLGGLVPAVLISFIYLVVKHRKYAFLFITPLLIFSVLFFLKYEKLSTLLTGTGRLEVWKAGILIWCKKPLIGWGFNQCNYLWRISITLMNEPMKFLHYHNEYLNTLMELGFIGLWIIIGYFADLFLKIKKSFSDEKILILCLAIIAGLINAIVNFTMHTIIGLVLIIYFACIDKMGEENAIHSL